MPEKLLHATVSVRGVVTGPREQVLVLRRATDGEWELPGGRLEPAEEPVHGLKREIAEETGLTPDIADILSANTWINDDGKGRFAVHYHCHTAHRDVEISAEHVEAEWASRTHAEKVLCDPQATAVQATVESTATNVQSAHLRSN